MHLGDDGVVIDWGGIFEKRGAVDVKCRTGESILRIPVITRRLTGYEVKGLDWVVEIELLDLGARRDRLLSLGDQHILGLGSEDLTLLGIKIRVVGVYVPLETVISGCSTPSNSKLYVVVLERNEWKCTLPVFTESEAKWVKVLIF